MNRFAKVAKALWPTLRRLILRIGRWVLRSLREHGVQALAGYMRIRANDVFKARLGRARAKWRKRWLRGRIRRWLAVADWLEMHVKTINDEVADALEVLGIADKIPMCSPWERREAA